MKKKISFVSLWVLIVCLITGCLSFKLEKDSSNDNRKEDKRVQANLKFEDVLFPYQIGEQIRLIKDNLQFVSNLRFDFISTFNQNGLVLGKTFSNGKMQTALFDSKGNILFDSEEIGINPMSAGPFKWQYIQSQNGHLSYSVYDDELNNYKTGLIDREGNIIIEPQNITIMGFNSLSYSTFYNNESNRMGIISDEGKIILEDFAYITVLNNHYFAGNKYSDDKTKFYDNQGQEIVEDSNYHQFFRVNDDLMQKSYQGQDYQLIDIEEYIEYLQGEKTTYQQSKETRTYIDSGNESAYAYFNDYNGYFGIIDKQTLKTIISSETDDVIDFIGYPTKDGYFPYIEGANIGLLNPEKLDKPVVKTSLGHNTEISTINGMPGTNIIEYSPDSDKQLYVLDTRLKELKEAQNDQDSEFYMNSIEDGIYSIYRNIEGQSIRLVFGYDGQFIAQDPENLVVYGDKVYYQLKDEAFIQNIRTGEVIKQGVPEVE